MTFNYTFNQISTETVKGCMAMFMPYTWQQKNGGVDLELYYTEDSGTVEASSPLAACEKLFTLYNIDPPKGYHGRSMSVSDVVCLWEVTSRNEAPATAWFCDSIGFQRIA